MSARTRAVFLAFGATIIFGLFSLKSLFAFDTDFFWQLRMGQMILSSGIPKTDPFSYTMPSYPYIDHSWFSGVLLAVAYPIIGKTGLAIFVTFLAASALAISLSLSHPPRKYFLLPLLLCLPIAYALMAIRPLVVTWLFLALLLKVTLTKDLWKKWKYVVPLLFILWVNLHGGFAIGLFTLALLTSAKAFQDKRLPVSEIIVFIMSLVATNLNPYGPFIWREVFATTSSLSLQFRVSEWLPTALVIFEPALFIFSFLTTVMVVKYRDRFASERLYLYFAFFVLAAMAIRHVPLFIIVSLPMSVDALGYFADDAKKIRHGLNRFLRAYEALIVAAVIILSLEVVTIFVPLFQNNFSSDSLYPKSAAHYIQDHKTKGHIFTSWVWGGYIIWELQGEKDFVDGRMASWGWDRAKNGQADPAPYLYNSILLDKIDYRQVFQKFDIETVLWSNTLASQSSQSFGIIDQLRSFLKRIGVVDTSSQDFLAKLIRDGWKIVYSDRTAVVLRKDVTMNL